MSDYRNNNRNKTHNPYPSFSGERPVAYGGSSSDSEKRKKMRIQKQKRKQRLMLYGLFIIIAVLIITIIGVATRKNGSEVTIGGKNLGQVKGKNLTSEYFANTVIAQLQGELSTNVQINEKIESKPVHVNKKKLVTIDHMLTQIKNNITYKVEASVINIEGVDAVILKNETEANDLLQKIINEYIPEDSSIVKEECGFVENVQVISKYVNSDEISTIDSGYQLLTNGTQAKRSYSVKSGDSLYKIAQSNGTTVEDLLSANPDITIDTGLKVGQTINLTFMKPFVSVKTIEYATYIEKADKEQEIRYDNTKDSGYKKVIQHGKDGQKEVTSQIVRVNGFEEEQKVVSEKVTQEPVKEIIVIGTR